MIKPKMGAKPMEKISECEIPLWNAIACKSDINGLASTSRSGIVPAIAPQSSALLPTFLPRAISPIPAPRTICVKESI